MVDESALTGESVPVRKLAGTDENGTADSPGGEDRPQVWSGTMVVRGREMARVTATGPAPSPGKIGPVTYTNQARGNPAERRYPQNHPGRCHTGIISLRNRDPDLCFWYADWLKGVLSGLTLAMALLPEELPIVLTTFLTLGSWRLARHQLLARKAAVIETLGAATALCTDKSGTLTCNQMQLVTALPDISGSTENELVTLTTLASAYGGFDPMDTAIHIYAVKAGISKEHTLKMLREYPLEAENPVIIQAWQAESGQILLDAKGAPEAIFSLCDIPDNATERILLYIQKLAVNGMRVLGVASSIWPESERLPHSREAFNLHFQGLLGFTDPVREHVPEAVEEYRKAGIKVVMITGDYPETARQVGRQIGFLENSPMLTEEEIDTLAERPDGLFQIRNTSVFSHVTPSQKLRIVEALKSGDEVVAMTGDGVNDAPALKAAHR